MEQLPVIVTPWAKIGGDRIFLVVILCSSHCVRTYSANGPWQNLMQMLEILCSTHMQSVLG